MAIPKSAIVEAFEKRYDYVSARNVLKQVLAAASMDDKDSYSEAEVSALSAQIEDLGDRGGDITAHLEELSGGAAPAKAPAKKDDKKADDKKADDKKADDKKADAKKADDKKADDKKDAKSEGAKGKKK